MFAGALVRGGAAASSTVPWTSANLKVNPTTAANGYD